MQRNNQAYTFKRAWLLLFAMEPKSRIKSWKSWFIFNLQKININQYCESIRGNEIIMIRTGDILQELMATSIIWAKKYTVKTLYILEHPSSWSTLQIFMASIQA